MSPAGLRPLPYRKVARRLQEFGFVPVRQVGSHVRFVHPDGRKTTVAHHARSDLRKELVMKVLRQAGIDPAEFLAGIR